MSKKSIGQQIVKPRETYIDGYGQQREVYEPQGISTARNLYNKGKDVYNKIDRRINPGKYIELTDPETGEMYKPTLNSGIDLFTLKMGGVLKSHQNAKIPLYLQYFNYNK